MSTDATHTASGDHRGGRANRPGPRAVYLLAAAAALVLAAVIVLLIAPGGSPTSSAAAGFHLQTSSVYGHVPSWDKIPEPAPVKIVTASAAHPDLKAMEGYPVNAKLPAGSVQYSAEGPQVPSWVANEAASAHWKLGETAPSAFYATFTGAKGAVPLSPADFTVITYTGRLLHPHITTAAGGPLPSSVAPGQTVKLKLETSLPEGDGEIRWAPAGGRILVSYFWTLEFD
jgi:hypothetical protein